MAQTVEGADLVGRRLVTPLDLSDRLQVPVRTLDQWAYQGKGPRAIRVGRHRRYLPEDVEAWLNDQKAAAP